MRASLNSNTLRERVYSVVRAIPKGETRFYGQVACLAGAPGAARAVGTLMRKNADPTVPCHRVICADGRIGQYNQGGTHTKIARLIAEGVQIVQGRVVSASCFAARKGRGTI